METKKVKVINQVERKTYIKGNFIGKYHGDLDKSKSIIDNVNYFDINVYEGELNNVKIISKKKYNSISSEIHFLQNRFENVISNPKERIKDYDAFRFKIHDPKVQLIEIKDVIKEENKTFGTFSCIVYGYLIDFIDQEDEIEIVETCEKCNKSLDSCVCLLLPEIPKEDGPKPPNGPGNGCLPNLNGCFELFGWLVLICIAIVFLFAIGVEGIIVLLFFAAIYFLLSNFSRASLLISSLISWVFRIWIVILGIVFFVSLISGFWSEFNIVERKVKSQIVEHDSEKKDGQGKVIDSNVFITHHRVWKDYENRFYSGNLSVLKKDYYLSYQNRNNSDFYLSNDYQWSELYNNLIANDYEKLKYVFATFDSIGKANSLNRIQFANMVVSCIQDIPYSLVLQEDCEIDHYQDEFIKSSLDKCPNCCIGDIKYGVQAPVEFIANLKGDCDTRTVILFTILSRFGYDVVILGSMAYQHSVIGIKLPYNSGVYKMINGEKYYLWETTASGFQPGVISSEITDMNLWNVHLKIKSN